MEHGSCYGEYSNTLCLTLQRWLLSEFGNLITVIYLFTLSMDASSVTRNQVTSCGRLVAHIGPSQAVTGLEPLHSLGCVLEAGKLQVTGIIVSCLQYQEI